MIREYPESMAYSFAELSEARVLRVSDAGDGGFRVYSWDTYSANKGYCYGNLIQYRSSGRVLVRTFGQNTKEVGADCQEVHLLRIMDKTFYLQLSIGRSLRNEGYALAAIYTIEADTLRHARLINTQEGLSSSLLITYRQPRQMFINPIRYIPDKYELIVPRVRENGKLTGETLVYRFMGSSFQPQ